MGVSGGCAATIFAKCSGKLFFKFLLCPRILADVARARGNMREPERGQQLADAPLVIVHAEARSDQLLEIDAAPEHDPIPFGIGTGLDSPRKRRHLRRGVNRRNAPFGLRSIRPAGPPALNR